MMRAVQLSGWVAAPVIVGQVKTSLGAPAAPLWTLASIRVWLKNFDDSGTS